MSLFDHPTGPQKVRYGKHGVYVWPVGAQPPELPRNGSAPAYCAARTCMRKPVLICGDGHDLKRGYCAWHATVTHDSELGFTHYGCPEPHGGEDGDTTPLF